VIPISTPNEKIHMTYLKEGCALISADLDIDGTKQAEVVAKGVGQ
jgi:hypothetical protein